jgi:hypothetical protein
MKTGGISGLAVAMVAAGGLLMYAAIKNYTLLDTLRWALRGGRGPTPSPRPDSSLGFVSLGGGDFGAPKKKAPPKPTAKNITRPGSPAKL